jgi:hypothetical protein
MCFQSLGRHLYGGKGEECMNVQGVSVYVGRDGFVAEAALAPLVEMNTQCVELLCAMAHRPGLRLPPLLAGAPQVWQALTPDACLRLAHVPWLLVDAGFSAGGLWRGLGGVCEPMSPPVAAPLSGEPFFGEEARDYFRRVLMFCWHLARTSPQLARIVLGISPTLAQELSLLRLAELDALAQRHPGVLRPRWENSPGLWRMLLMAAQQQDGHGIAEASLQGIQLMAATCLPSLTAPVRAATCGYSRGDGPRRCSQSRHDREAAQ